MKVLTIVAGVNGTGKSSFLGVLKEHGDDKGPIFDFDRDVSIVGNRYTLSMGDSFVIETSELGIPVLDIVKDAFQSGYHIQLYYIGLNEIQESLARISNRIKRGGFDCPDDRVVSQFDHRWHHLAELLPYCGEGRFYDNDNGFVEVGEYRNGELILIGKQHPAWIKELKDFLEMW